MSEVNFTENLKMEHKILADTLLEIEALGAKRAEKGIKLLLKVKHMLTAHLRKEDYILYPKLQESDNPEASKMGLEFAHEMKKVSFEVLNFFLKYESIKAIETKPDEYLDDLNLLIKDLKIRIGKEEKFLYPMYDSEASTED